MPLSTQINDLATRIGVELKALRQRNAQVMQFSAGGVLVAGAGTFAVPILWPCTIEKVAARVTTAPTGTTLLTLDVNKNGTTIFGTQGNRPIFASSSLVATVGAHSVSALAMGDYLTVDIDSVGNTVAGSNLVVAIGLQRTGV